VGITVKIITITIRTKILTQKVTTIKAQSATVD